MDPFICIGNFRLCVAFYTYIGPFITTWGPFASASPPPSGRGVRGWSTPALLQRFRSLGIVSPVLILVSVWQIWSFIWYCHWLTTQRQCYPRNSSTLQYTTFYIYFICHRHSQDFLWGYTFPDQKSDDLFFFFLVITFFPMVICVIPCGAKKLHQIIFLVTLSNLTRFFL